MHLDDDRIQRSLHGELDSIGEREIDQHLSECAPCRQRLEEAKNEEAWIFDQLRLLDHAAPVTDAATIAATARALGDEWRNAHLAPARWIAPAWRTPRLRWAAIVVIALLAAGAAYTMPGSPVRAWIDSAARWVSGGASHTTPGRPITPGPSASPAAGIAVTPGDRFTIRFEASQAQGDAVVSLGDGAEIIVRASNGAVGFTSDMDRLVIQNSGARAAYEITLPRTARWVEIVIEERRILLKDGGRIVVDSAGEGDGRYRLPLRGGGR